MRLTKLLAFRLFIIIFVVSIVGTAIFTTIMVTWQTDQYISTIVRTAWRTGELIRRSTRYSMLLNRREDIFQTITTIGALPGIDGIRIYDKRGQIHFSTDTIETGKSVDMTAEACVGCHVQGKVPVPRDSSRLTRIFTSRAGHRVLGIITPIHNEPSCSSAECHVHPASQTVLGVLDVMVPLTELDANLAEVRRVNYTNGLINIGIITLCSGVFLWLMVNIPVRRLTHGTQEVMKGNLDYRIPIHTGDEIGRLAASFNEMTDELKRARGELTRWAETLEQRVKEKTEELRRAQAGMVHMDKMASLGKLAATVAHELNNPLEGVLTYTKLLRKRIRAGEMSPAEAEEIIGDLSIIADETARCGNIVNNLLLFSRRNVGDFSEEDLRSIIEQSLRLIDHHLKMNNIALQAELGEQPLTLLCDSHQIEQALLGIEINAVEAMPGGGTLRIAARRFREEDALEITVSDTGNGIWEEDLPHIFEPFFTTKKDGKGTGLGLAVAYGIIEGHGGSIDVDSHAGAGTTFTIRLPRHLGTPAGSSSISQQSGPKP
ncbi:MAG: two-component sensor histidine kinase [Ignavibacteriales bacterium CG07_land_8_20_14_0_80_59_12]|nr:MAG: two-component sensor histidine kinase [Ignavibacteriales bacterium CG07_land_8_20_14_0_80_59_12]